MPTVCLNWGRSCVKCEDAMVCIQLANSHRRDAELHAIQWPPELLDIIRHTVRMDVQRNFGPKMKAKHWRAVHEELLKYEADKWLPFDLAF